MIDLPDTVLPVLALNSVQRLTFNHIPYRYVGRNQYSSVIDYETYHSGYGDPYNSWLFIALTGCELGENKRLQIK